MYSLFAKLLIVTTFLWIIFISGKTFAVDSQPTESSSGFKSPSTGMEFVFIPGDCYQMGFFENNPGKPGARVCLDDFFIGKYEVTQQQWKSLMKTNPSRFDGKQRPVERVTWEDVHTFLKKLNKAESTRVYRLPTEAEWEFAARAGTSTLFYWGNEIDNDYAWYFGNSNYQTHPVGQKKPNGYGLFDMFGNVWEWVQDWYSKDYWRHAGPQNPTGPKNGKFRVRRGGSWANATSYIRSAIRYRSKPDHKHTIIGFRLASSTAPSSK